MFRQYNKKLKCFLKPTNEITKNWEAYNKQHSPLYQIPPEIFLYILSYVDFKSILIMREVAKNFENIVEEDFFWENEIKNTFCIKDEQLIKENNQSYFDVYLTKLIECQNYIQVTLYLSGDGSSIKLATFTPDSHLRNVVKEDNVHPILKNAEKCNSYEDVIALLTRIKNSPNCTQYVHLYHTHFNHRMYPGHSSPKGRAHEDSIDKMIEFVKKRKYDDEHANKSVSICRLS